MDISKEEIRRKIHGIYAKILGTGKDFGNDDAFLKLGGQSISAMKLQIELMREFKVKLPFSKIFRFDTVNKLSDMVYELQSSSNDADK